MILLLPGQTTHLIAGYWDWVEERCFYKLIKNQLNLKIDLMQTINRTQLFRASCLALLVTSLSFGIRAGILNQIGSQFNLDKTDLASITATAFW